MSKHRSSSDECCYNPMMYGYGMGNYGMSAGGGQSCGSGNNGGWGVRWIYALLVLIVIVLQFGRRNEPVIAATNGCGDETVAATPGLLGGFGGFGFGNNQLIDNSVLFIIVVFLLILCAGCWGGGYGNYGAAGASGMGYVGGGYGY